MVDIKFPDDNDVTSSASSSNNFGGDTLPVTLGTSDNLQSMHSHKFGQKLEKRRPPSIFLLLITFLMMLILSGIIFLFFSLKKQGTIGSSFSLVGKNTSQTTGVFKSDEDIIEQHPPATLRPNANDDLVLYKVKITPLRLDYRSPELSLYELLDLPNGYINGDKNKRNMVVDERVEKGPSSSVYDYDIYFLADGFSIDTSKIYEDDYFLVKFEKADQNLIPFVRDRRYCEKDSDCRLSTPSYNSSCYEGVVNRFSTFYSAADCTPGIGGEGEDAGCIEKMVDFDKISCIKNECVGVGEKFYEYNHCTGKKREL